MSLQPCLPLPKPNRRRGRPASTSRSTSRDPTRNRNRKRPPGAVADDDDEQEAGDIDEDNMDDDDDVGRQRQRQRQRSGLALPLLSGRQKISDLADLSALDFIGLVHEEAKLLGDVFVRDVQRGKDVKEEEGEIRLHHQHGDKHKHAHAPAARSSSCGGVGISGSLAYLLSDRTDLPPPPSAAHLPLSFSSSSSSTAASSTAASSSNIHVWVNSTLDDFSRLRLYLDACADEEVDAEGGGVGSKRGGMRMPVPPMRAGDAWHVFCFGNEAETDAAEAEAEADVAEAEAEADRHYQDGDDNDDDNDDGRRPTTPTVEPWEEVDIPPAGHPPTTALLCQMDQVMTRRVLSHHISYLTAGDSSSVSMTMTARRARWLYGLLARMHKPLHRDDAALLRRLLRECCVRRAGLDLTGAKSSSASARASPRASASSASTRGVGHDGNAAEEISLLNTLIAVVGVYFEQGTVAGLFSLTD